MPTTRMAPAAESVMPSDDAPTSTNKEALYGEFDQNRKALNDDMRKRWLAGIAEAEKQKTAHTPPAAVSPAREIPNAALNAKPVQPIASGLPAMTSMGTNSEPSDTGTRSPRAERATSSPVGTQRRADLTFGRMAATDEMSRMRMAAIAEAAAANEKQTAEVVPFTAPQRQTLEAFLAEVDGVSRALAADDLKQYNQHVARFAKVLPAMDKELAASQRWGPAIFRVLALGQGTPPKTLADARNRFLPYSSAMVDLAKQLKKQDPVFAGLKMYHCPMAPKPGLWLQAKGPLANPFYGAEMLTCGEEVKP